MVRVGVLALQGGFHAHLRALAELGVGAVEVRRAAELDRMDGLVLPGGESTTLLKHKFNAILVQYWTGRARLLMRTRLCSLR